MTHSRIIGTGSYLPEKVLTNDDLARIVETSDEWVRTRTGIRSRHVAADGEMTSDLALAASQKAIAAACSRPTSISSSWPRPPRT
jgi:3-oxoacyl-[acyl-carrier-protein] synthase-3